MIVSVREFPSEPLPGDHDVDSLNSALPYHVEYLVDTSSSKGRLIATPPTTSQAAAAVFTVTSRIDLLGSRVSKVFVELFLPLGYPHSVDPSYLPYQLYDGLQGLCSYWRGVVAMRAVLEATGVGDALATASSAAVQWALRDGMGMMGGLVFSYVASSCFDTHVKEFRLFADVINDVALTLDMLASYAGPNGRLYILSLSTIGKTMCGISAGATKGRITQHFSRHGNMADLTAKESTQETLVSLLGMIGGVWMANLLQHLSYSVTWILFGILTLVHVWANYKAVKLLKLTTLNPERTRECMKGVVDVLLHERGDPELVDALTRIPEPEEVDESLARSTINLLFPAQLVNPPAIHVEHFSFADLFCNEKYIIGTARDGKLVIYLSLGATSEDELMAHIHGIIVQAMLKTTKGAVNRDLMKR